MGGSTKVARLVGADGRVAAAALTDSTGTTGGRRFLSVVGVGVAMLAFRYGSLPTRACALLADSAIGVGSAGAVSIRGVAGT